MKVFNHEVTWDNNQYQIRHEGFLIITANKSDCRMESLGYPLTNYNSQVICKLIQAARLIHLMLRDNPDWRLTEDQINQLEINSVNQLGSVR